MDSAYESTLFLYFKSAAFLLIAIAILALVIAFGACLAKTVAYFNGFSDAAALTGVGIAMIALSPMIGSLLFLNSWKPVPGAIDDMSGVSVVAGLGKYLGEAKSSGDWFPERTEVVLLGISSEEAGCRGSKRYVRKHLKEMKAIRTYFLAIDIIKDENFLTVWKVEPYNGARHDHELVTMAQEVAASHKWAIAVRSQPWGTDAVLFSLSRIPVAWLELIDTSKIYPTVHSMRDTYEHVRPEALSVALQLVIDMTKRIDRS
jgi:aminopeptidase-like protein